MTEIKIPTYEEYQEKTLGPESVLQKRANVIIGLLVDEINNQIKNERREALSVRVNRHVSEDVCARVLQIFVQRGWSDSEAVYSQVEVSHYRGTYDKQVTDFILKGATEQ